MIPTVRTPEDAQKAVQAAFFPPLGSRSIAFPISPQLGRAVAGFLESANDETLLILQIETKESMDHLQEILNTPGVDAVFIGPFDLSYDLGLFDKYGYPGGLSSQELRDASQRIAQECKRTGRVAAGSFAAGFEGAAVLVKEGFTLLAAGTDVGLLGGAAKAEAERLNELRSSV
jgi:2-keto-3-deoxy-L-rhamnonate aldolase RhmA